MDQACLAVDEGADIIIAQGAEAGGYGGYGSHIGGMVLVPQVVEAVAPLPVIAAGGINDGRGLAAVLLLGAAGANIGTRFLASVEAALSDEVKQRLVDAPSDETVRIDAPGAVTPSAVSAAAGRGHRPARAVAIAPARYDPGSQLDLPSSGQGAGAIHSVKTAADIVAGLTRSAEESLLRARTLVVERVSVGG